MAKKVHKITLSRPIIYTISVFLVMHCIIFFLVINYCSRVGCTSLFFCFGIYWPTDWFPALTHTEVERTVNNPSFFIITGLWDFLLYHMEKLFNSSDFHAPILIFIPLSLSTFLSSSHRLCPNHFIFPFITQATLSSTPLWDFLKELFFFFPAKDYLLIVSQ